MEEQEPRKQKRVALSKKIEESEEHVFRLFEENAKKEEEMMHRPMSKLNSDLKNLH